ncbi:MAG: pseudouridine synthase [Balneolales bacterium]
MSEHSSHKNRSVNKNPRTKTTGGKPERTATAGRKSGSTRHSDGKPERPQAAGRKPAWPQTTEKKQETSRRSSGRSEGPRSGGSEQENKRGPGRKPAWPRSSERKPERTRLEGGKYGRSRTSNNKTESDRGPASRYGRNKGTHRGPASESAPSSREDDSKIRLNKYIAHAGICSRREADEYISAGKVQVNGKRCTEMGVLVNPADRVTVDGQTIEPEPFVYILMNKPRDTITTTSDEKGRKTVMDVIENATGLRVYPVGRLDRNTTGLILLTNDGDLANRLMHPSYKVRKVYEVETDREITDDELHQFRTGISLDDGPARAYRASRHPDFKNIVTLSMHEGRNRVVRRMFEAIGADVVKLDRVTYGPLQKKGLRIGRWRKLRNNEVNDLRKMVQLLPMPHLDKR